MQLLNPIQSTRERPREALRLHSWIFQVGGPYLLTYFRAWCIDCSCLFMQRGCQRQTWPMFNTAGFIRIAGLRATSADEVRVSNAKAKPNDMRPHHIVKGGA